VHDCWFVLQVQLALKAGVETDPAVYAAPRDVLSYEAIDKRPYIHLLDSGISDNMGIRAPQLSFKTRHSCGTESATPYSKHL
jgi:hypothetical protein